MHIHTLTRAIWIGLQIPYILIPDCKQYLFRPSKVCRLRGFFGCTGALAPCASKALPHRSALVHATPSVDSPGYPLEYPGPFWTAAAAFAYTFLAVLVFNDAALPETLTNFIFSIFKDHQTISNLGLGAVAVHVGYVIFALNLSRKRGYDAKASAWWASTCFFFGGLSLKMLLDKEWTASGWGEQ